MKNIRDAIAALTAEQKQNDYELTIVLMEIFGDDGLQEILETSFYDISIEQSNCEKFDRVIEREIGSHLYGFDELRKWLADNPSYLEDAKLESDAVGDYDFGRATMVEDGHPALLVPIAEWEDDPDLKLEYSKDIPFIYRSIMEKAFYIHHREICAEQLEKLVDAIHSVISDFLNPEKSVIA